MSTYLHNIQYILNNGQKIILREFMYITLESRIDVGQVINVGPGNLAKMINLGL
jgi:hypothetical protein